MSTSSSLAALAPVLLLTAIILILVARRTIQMVRGTPVSPTRLFGLTALYLLLFALIILASLFQLPWYSPLVDLAVVALAALAASSYVRQHVKLERRPPSNEYYYQLNPVIPIVFIVIFVVRFVINFVLLGTASTFTPPTNGTASASPLVVLTPDTALILVLVDALFAFSAGLLVGRSVGVYLEYRERLHADAAAPLPPG